MPRTSSRVGVEVASTSQQPSAELLKAKKAERRARARQRADEKRVKTQPQEQQQPQQIGAEPSDGVAVNISSSFDPASHVHDSHDNITSTTGDRFVSKSSPLMNSSPEIEESIDSAEAASKKQSPVLVEFSSLEQASAEYGTEEVLDVNAYVTTLQLQQQQQHLVSVVDADTHQAVALSTSRPEIDVPLQIKTTKLSTKKAGKTKYQQHERAPSQDVAATTIQKALKRKFLKQCAPFLRHSSKVFAAMDVAPLPPASCKESDAADVKCNTGASTTTASSAAEWSEQRRKSRKPRAASSRESSTSPVHSNDSERSSGPARRNCSESAAKTKQTKSRNRSSRRREQSSSSSSSSSRSRSSSNVRSNSSDRCTYEHEHEHGTRSSSRSSRSQRSTSSSSSLSSPSSSSSESQAPSATTASKQRISVSKKKKRFTKHPARQNKGDEHRIEQSTAPQHASAALVGASNGPSVMLLSDLEATTLSLGCNAIAYDKELHRRAATKLQAWLRGVEGRERALRRRIEFEREVETEALREVHDEASVRIQAIARGFLIRRELDVLGKSPTSVRADKATAKQKTTNRRTSIAAFFRGTGVGVEDVASIAATSPAPIDESASEDVDGADRKIGRGSRASRRGSDEQEVAAWPTEFNLETLDEWDELNSPANVHGDAVTHAHFLAKGRLRVFCGTWNMHAKKPQDDLQRWIPRNKYHVVAVGSEECVHSIAKSVVFTSKKQWETQLTDALGDEYVLVASHALTAIHNIVFVHESVLPLLSNIQSDAVATGLGNQLGNKGGVGIAFSIGRTSLAFVNAHFDAHQHNTEKRNSNFHRINHELKLFPSQSSSVTSPAAMTPSSAAVTGTSSLDGLGRKTTTRFSMTSSSLSSMATGAALPTGMLGKKLAISECFDRVFWFGDLNYRINGTRRMVDLLLLHNKFEVLRFNDQLQIEMAKGTVFAHFQEGPLHFRPTYKFDKHSNVYDSSSKQRIPSWTDRILYLSNEKPGDIEILSYRSQMDFQTSDHRPVGAAFQVSFKGVHSVVGSRDKNSGAADGSLDQDFTRVLARGYKRSLAKSEVCTVQ